MDPEEKSTGSRKAFGVIAGLVTMFITGLILYPLVYEIFDKYFELNFSNKSEAYTKGDLIIFFTMMAWIFISTLMGGFIASAISKGNEYTVSWILSGIVIFLLLVLVIADMGSIDLSSLLSFAVFTALIIAGFRAGAALEVRRRKKNTNISNTPSSPAGNP